MSWTKSALRCTFWKPRQRSFCRRPYFRVASNRSRACVIFFGQRRDGRTCFRSHPVLSSFRTRDSKLIGGQNCFTAQGCFLRHFPASHSLRSEDGVGQRGRCCVWGGFGRGAEGGFSERNILHPTGFSTPLCGPMARVQELPRGVLAQGPWNRGGLSGLGPEATLAFWCGLETLRSRQVCGSPCRCGRGSLRFSRGRIWLATNLERFFLYRQKIWTFAESGTKMNMRSSPRRGSRKREKRRMVRACSVKGCGYSRAKP